MRKVMEFKARAKPRAPRPPQVCSECADAVRQGSLLGPARLLQNPLQELRAGGGRVMADACRQQRRLRAVDDVERLNQDLSTQATHDGYPGTDLYL